MKFGYTIMYVENVEQTVEFYEAAFGLSRRFIHEGGYAEMDTGDTTLAFINEAGQGIGGKLLAELRKLTSRPVLIGTWAAATWAIKFYEKHGFRLVTPAEKDRLLKKYWSIPERQVETSVVLGDERWFNYRLPLVRHRDQTEPLDCPFGHVQRMAFFRRVP